MLPVTPIALANDGARSTDVADTLSVRDIGPKANVYGSTMLNRYA